MRLRTFLSLLLAGVMLAIGLPAGSASAGPGGWGVPLLSISQPTPDAYTNSQRVTVTGKTTGFTVRMMVNREPTLTASVDTSGTFSRRIRLRDGANTIGVIARRGNKERLVNCSIWLDRQKPGVVSSVVRRAVFSSSSRARVKRKIATYRVSEPVRVIATISTRAGKRLRTLHQGIVKPGRAQVINWNGRNRRGRFVNSGLYRMTLATMDRAGNVTAKPLALRVKLNSITRAMRICRTALRYRGVRYSWGGMSPRGFDCSGLVGYAYRRNGIGLPRTSRSMAHVGRRVSRGRLKPADILLFNTSGGGISHAGIYLGRGRFIHASSGKGRVVVSSLGRGYYRSRLVTARRVTR